MMDSAATYTVITETSMGACMAILAEHVSADAALDAQESYNLGPEADDGLTYAVILDDRDALPACMVELGMAGGAWDCECHRCVPRRRAS